MRSPLPLLLVAACSNSQTGSVDGALGRDAESGRDASSGDARGQDAAVTDGSAQDVSAPDTSRTDLGPVPDAGGNGDSGAQTISGCPTTLPADWIFCEDFESGDLSRFAEKSDSEHLQIVADGNARSGSRALFVPSGANVGFEGGSATWSSWPTGYEELHLRSFVRLADDFDTAHHFPLGIWGSRRDDMYSSYGLAGCRPNGSNFFTTQLDLTRDFGNTPAPGRFMLYTYWPDMQCDSGANCANYANPVAICDNCATRGAPCLNGLECCWGENLAPPAAIIPPRGQYQCLEMSARLNDLGASNGWIAFSIEGSERYRQEGLSIRSSDVLELSTAIVGIYNARGDSNQPNQAWFDDMVISTTAIGCR